jgi:hypothetical protein
MVEQKENIGYRIIESVLAVIFILFALAYLNGSANNSLKSTKNNISKEVVLSQEIAVVSTESQVIPANNQEFSKTRFPVEKFMSLIITKNRKNDIIIILQRNKSSQRDIFPVFVCYRQTYPPEKDEVPLES